MTMEWIYTIRHTEPMRGLRASSILRRLLDSQHPIFCRSRHPTAPLPAAPSEHQDFHRSFRKYFFFNLSSYFPNCWKYRPEKHGNIELTITIWTLLILYHLCRLLLVRLGGYISNLDFYSYRLRIKVWQVHPGYVRHVDSSSLGFSLSSHRQSYIGLVFSSRFIDLIQ